MTTGDLVTRVYGNFRGVDFRGEEVNLRRSPDSLNVWRDYRGIESIRTRPGMKKYFATSAKVNGIYFYKGNMLLHYGTALCVIEPDFDGGRIYNSLADAPSRGFVYNDIFYLMDGKNYIQYDGNTVKEVEGYVPTTSIGRSPSGGGTIHEDVNMLSPYRINTFLGNGEDKKFYLDAAKINGAGVVSVTVDDVEMPEFAENGERNWKGWYEEGRVDFTVAPPAPLTDGQDNVKIKFHKKVEGYKENVLNCTLLQVFDNRVFVSGNPNYPNVVWHCSLNDPTYFSDLDYYREGMDEAKIKGLVAGNNALWVFREPSEANTNVFYHTPTIDAEYGKIYPSSHSSVTTGCVGKAINFNDDIVFFSNQGMEGISGDITTEQVVAHRSSLVDRKMTAERNYTNMILEEWEGYLLVIIGGKVYLADSRTAFTNEDHIEYDWFYWELEEEITCARVYNGVLYLGTDYGVFAMSAEVDANGEYTQQTDNGVPFESYWVTPKDKFKAASKLKTTNKRGCVAEAKGDITVYVKTEDTDFELVGKYENVTDCFVSRIKRKKWKDIQLKFYSETSFSLEQATLEAFIGGYIKR